MCLFWNFRLRRHHLCTAHGKDQGPSQVQFSFAAISLVQLSPVCCRNSLFVASVLQHSFCLSLLADYLKPGNVVLDVGSGSGYLTAVFG